MKQQKLDTNGLRRSWLTTWTLPWARDLSALSPFSRCASPARTSRLQEIHEKTWQQGGMRTDRKFMGDIVAHRRENELRCSALVAHVSSLLFLWDQTRIANYQNIRSLEQILTFITPRPRIALTVLWDHVDPGAWRANSKIEYAPFGTKFPAPSVRIRCCFQSSDPSWLMWDGWLISM